MVRRRRTGELRTRTGCNQCRQRRVKCPEEKPACSMCHSLGYACSYDKVLRWHSPQGFDGLILPNKNTVEDWMFLHAFSADFDSSKARPFLNVSARSENAPSSPSFDYTAHSDDDLDLLQPWLSPMAMSPVESYLWDYFHSAIAPSCVLNPAVNPYQDIFLRIAASTGKTFPLFNIIMAISARERAILGDGQFHRVALTYHHQAVRLLRLETAKMEQGVADQISKAQILATVMALVFLDIMSDCSNWWVVHSDFARSLVHKFRTSQEACDPDLKALFNFVGGYIVVHEVYAHTAWKATTSTSYQGLVTDMCDDANLQTLTGCSTEFLQLLADVNSLAADFTTCSKLDYVDPDVLSSFEQRRHDLERRLHEGSCFDGSDGLDAGVSESDLTIELKRLTGLLHLYSRLDHLGPRDPTIAHLATKILSLIARVPTRSNIILWPLFMVATLGIGLGCDSDRAFILSKLDQLQRTRQMRYIKKARDIATEVWKVRDLEETGLGMGWDILNQTSRIERLSLF